MQMSEPFGSQGRRYASLAKSSLTAIAGGLARKQTVLRNIFLQAAGCGKGAPVNAHRPLALSHFAAAIGGSEWSDRGPVLRTRRTQWTLGRKQINDRLTVRVCIVQFHD